jgi:hypothetical protein
MRFAVTVISPLDYSHSQAFTDVALALHGSLQDLGHDSLLSTRLDNRGRRHLIFGANLLPRYPMPVPPDAVVINLEQVSADSVWMTPAYVEILRRCTVWDYSGANIARLGRLGVQAALLPIGYHPQLSRITLGPSPDIDVLFYGSVSDRRRTLLLALDDAGVRLHVAFNVYGRERDALIARSKLVLNLHHYSAQVFELARVSYLLANRVCVVSERGQDDALEQPFESAVKFATYDGLVAACLALLADPAARLALAQRGFEYFSGCNSASALAQRLAELPTER